MDIHKNEIKQPEDDSKEIEKLIAALISGQTDIIYNMIPRLRQLHKYLINPSRQVFAEIRYIYEFIVDHALNIHPTSMIALMKTKIMPMSFALRYCNVIINGNEDHYIPPQASNLSYVTSILTYILDENPELLITWKDNTNKHILSNYNENPFMADNTFINIITRMLDAGYPILEGPKSEFNQNIQNNFLRRVFTTADNNMLTILLNLYGREELLQIIDKDNINPYYLVLESKAPNSANETPLAANNHAGDEYHINRMLERLSTIGCQYKYGVISSVLRHTGAKLSVDVAKNVLGCNLDFSHPLIRLIKKYAIECDPDHTSIYVCETTRNRINNKWLREIRNYQINKYIQLDGQRVDPIEWDLEHKMELFAEFAPQPYAVRLLAEWQQEKPLGFCISDLIERNGYSYSIFEVLEYSLYAGIPWYLLI
jgi:hypothetical protein